MNLDNVSRDDWIVGGLALLLVIDLLFFPWFSIGGGSVGGVSIPSFDLSATDAPDGWLGVLAVLASLAVLVDLAIERLSPQTSIPAIGGSRAMTRFVLTLIAAFFMALKFLFHIHFSYFGWGFYLGVLLVAALVYFTMQARQAPAVLVPPAGTAPPAAPSAREPAAPPAPEPSAAPVADPQATRPRETIRPEGSPPPGSSGPPPGSSGPPPGSPEESGS